MAGNGLKMANWEAMIRSDPSQKFNLAMELVKGASFFAKCWGDGGSLAQSVMLPQPHRGHVSLGGNTWPNL